MSKRRLRPEELDLWNQVAASTDPLEKARRSIKVKSDSEQPSVFTQPSAQPVPVPRFEIGAKSKGSHRAQTSLQTTSQRVATAPVQMDSKAFGRLKRGKLKPEARIDLHGMTLQQAHPELIRFILLSQGRQLRLVLVITGKGSREDPYDPAPRRRGVLKAQVPQWLRMSPVAQAVLQVSEAHIRHGGEGAYYVYLRRNR